MSFGLERPPLAIGPPLLHQSPLRLTARERFRGLLWSALLLLTTALLAYPKQLTLEYAPIQSLPAFDNLPLFGALYTGWAAVTVALAFLLERRSRWEGLLLVILFVLVFRGIWDLQEPLRTPDGFGNATTINVIDQLGQLPQRHPNLAYLDFPGLHFLAVALKQATSLSLDHTALALLLLFDTLLAAFYYRLFLRLLGNVPWAVLGSLLATQGNIIFAEMFLYSGYLGLLFIATFILLLLEPRFNRGGLLGSPEARFLAILILGAATITHFVSSLVLPSLLLGLYALTYILRRKPARLPTGQAGPSGGQAYAGISQPSPLLYGLLPSAWLVYATIRTFDNIVHLGQEAADNLALEESLHYVFTVGAANFGPHLPAWANATATFWLVAVFGLGTAAGLIFIARARRLTGRQQKAVGAFLGVVLLSAVATAYSTGGFDFARFLMYGPFFSIPFFLWALRSLPAFFRRFALALVGLALVGLALPTFFAHYATVATDIFYPQEHAAARYLQTHYQDGQGLAIFTLGLSRVPYIHYLPEAQYSSEGEVVGLRDEAGLWQAVEQQVSHFESGRTEGLGLFPFSPRPPVFYRHILGIPLDAEGWQELRQRFQQQALIYDNGQTQLYAR